MGTIFHGFRKLMFMDINSLVLSKSAYMIAYRKFVPGLTIYVYQRNRHILYLKNKNESTVHKFMINYLMTLSTAKSKSATSIYFCFSLAAGKAASLQMLAVSAPKNDYYIENQDIQMSFIIWRETGNILANVTLSFHDYFRLENHDQ